MSRRPPYWRKMTLSTAMYNKMGPRQLPDGKDIKMTVRECYESIGGDYEDVKRRFLSDARIRRFALLFLGDGSMEDLRASIGRGDTEKAFQAAHTLKGVCLNLGFSGLYEPVNRLTELLRAGELEKALPDLKEVEKNYRTTFEGVKRLEEEF